MMQKKYLGVTSVSLNKLMSSEGIEWCNFRENGPIWISAQSITAYSWKAIRKKTSLIPRIHYYNFWRLASIFITLVRAYNGN